MLMFVPSGSLLMTRVLAPNASNTFFAIADALPLEQSRATVFSLKDRVATEIR